MLFLLLVWEIGCLPDGDSCQVNSSAFRLNRDRFVDDIATGGTQADVEWFKGVENVETMACDGTVSQIMSKTNLKLKAVVISGEPDGEKLKKLGASVLGLGFSTERDALFVKFRANFSGDLFAFNKIDNS